MKIDLENDVFAEVDKLTAGLFSHSEVIRKLLQRSAKVEQQQVSATSTSDSPDSNLLAHVQSAEYQMLTNAISKYLNILRWIHRRFPKDFQKMQNYRRGNRVYFATTATAIEEGGKGAIHAKRIPDTPLWTLATLDNRSKRMILGDLLRLFGFRSDEINAAVSTIADSGRQRTQRPLREYV